MIISAFGSWKLSLFVIAASFLLSHRCVQGYNSKMVDSASTQKGRYDWRCFAKGRSSAPGQSRSFSKKTISGQNIINVRSFNLDAPKTFSFDGSFKSIASLPTYSSPEIAFMGRSNVGKSSLLNCLTGGNKKIAVEGKTPGRTQSINVFNCQDKLGDICKFVDLPGYGYAKISKTQQSEISQFIGDYLIRRGALKLVILLIDPRREVQQYDQDMFKVGSNATPGNN
jgi:ribosome biogenesis GTP-binding protein YsxC/EngB